VQCCIIEVKGLHNYIVVLQVVIKFLLHFADCSEMVGDIAGFFSSFFGLVCTNILSCSDDMIRVVLCNGYCYIVVLFCS